MKKIILLYDFLKEIGGLERVMFFQANLLKKHHKPELYFSYVSNKDKDRIIRELELKNNVLVRSLGRINNEFLQLAKSFLLPSRIKKLRADLIIANSFMTSRMACYMKKKYGTPYVVVLYHPPNFIYSKVSGWANNIYRLAGSIWGIAAGGLLKNIDRRAVVNADLVVSISEYTKRRAYGIYGTDSIIIYPHVSDFFRIMGDKEKKEFLRKMNIKNKFLFAHGRIIPDKNYDLLFDIVSGVANMDLIISGSVSDNYRAKLMHLAKIKKVEKRVKILGRISSKDLLGYYNCAEIFLMPAKKEDFGLTPIEAMACGCPVVAWNDNAGPNETVIPKVNGLLARPYNVHDFAEKIKMGLKMRWDKKKIIKSVGKFSEKEVGDKFIEIIDELFHK